MVYRLISTKGTRQVAGTLETAIEVAIAMEQELQPAFGVSVEDAEGQTVADIRDGIVE